MMKYIQVLAFLVFMHAQLAAEQVHPSREDYVAFLPVWHAAYNDPNPEVVGRLFGPSSHIGVFDEMSDEEKGKFREGFTGLKQHFGDITAMELGVFIERKSRYVFKATYSNAGFVPGTITLEQIGDGTWKVANFNIDGQGEPELNQ